MTILKVGHLYELDSMEGTNPQRLQFIEKENVDGVFRTVNDGTTNEEVLLMLFDRLSVLYAKLPSKETAEAIWHIGEAMDWLERRTRNRLAQGVENTPLPHENK